MQGNYGDASMPVMQPANAGYYQAKKNLPCPYEGCDQLFTCKHNVTQHIKEKHLLVRDEICKHCQEVGKFTAFTRPASLFRHIRGVHNIEPEAGPRGRRRGPQGPRSGKKGVGRDDAPRPVVPVPSDRRINISNDPNYINPSVLMQAPQIVREFLC